VERCLECLPRRSYEVLDKFIPGKISTTLHHGESILLDPPGQPRNAEGDALCARCGNMLPLVGDPVFQTETGYVCERCTTTKQTPDRGGG
jgi:hypothetical protein